MSRLLLLSMAIAVGQFANSLVLPAVPMMARELGVPPGGAGLVVTAYFAGFAVVGLFVGPWSDRIGRRPLLWTGLAVLATGSLACALAPTFAVLLAFRLVEAAGAASAPVLARAIVRDTRRDAELATALGLLATAMSVSPVVGPVLGGIITDAVGWRWLFGILAGLGLATAIATWIAIPETLPPSTRPDAVPFAARMRQVWQRPHFRHGVQFAAAFYFAFGAVYTMMPFVLIERFGLSHAQFGLAFAVLSLGFTIGGLAGPRLMKVPMLLEATALVSACAGLLLLAEFEMADLRVAGVMGALSVFGLAFGVALSVGSAFTLSDAGDSAGAASSLSGFIQIGCAAVGSAIANLLHTGSVLPLGIILAAAGLVSLLAIRGQTMPLPAKVTRR